MLFATCLIVSNLIVGKMWSLAGTVTIPASVIIFPITYILSDVFTEVYGFRKTRTLIWLGFACNVVAVMAYVITVDLPHPAYWIDQDAYVVVLGKAPRILAASFVAYLIGEFSNSIIMSRLKIATKGEKLWMRIIGSTMIGEACDSAIFISIAFAGTLPAGQLLTTILYQYLFKVGFEVVFIPLTYKVIAVLKKKEDLDTYDYDVKYNIF